MSNSSDVVADTQATASQYNNLRADVLNTTTGHTHNGVDSSFIATVDSVKITTRILSWTTPAAEGGSVSIAHNLTSSKIRSVSVLVLTAAPESAQIQPDQVTHVGYAGYQYSVDFTNTTIELTLHATNSENILSRPYTVFIVYDES